MDFSLENAFLLILIVGVTGVFFWLFRKSNLLSYFSGGRWWLTWLSIAVITLMDELTSIFYAPAEAWRFIGTHAIAFIAITSLLMRVLSMRMVEIAEILEHHNIKGGGVYSFSYMVLGPTFSFVAVSSIMVDYILTACLSTVSAVENGLTFLPLGQTTRLFIEFGVVWGIATLNIIGIRENARFTFGIFALVSVVLLTLLATALMHASPASWTMVGQSFNSSFTGMFEHGAFGGFGYLVIGIASCILAYSGIESVVQTAGLVRSWRDIGRAYIFLAVTTGIFTPLICALALSSGLNPAQHETDLMAQFGAMLKGIPFGVLVGAIASIALIMAVNTAFVATSELIDRVAHRYDFRWINRTNRRQSLYRIHIMSAIFYSAIIVVTEGSQKILAEMYALGLVASFTINMGSLLIYRYSTGTKEIRAFNTSRTGTLIVFVILLSSLAYLMVTKVYGTALWVTASAVALLVGFRVARKRAPELTQVAQTDNPLQMIFDLADAPGEKLDIYFKRPLEGGSAPDPTVAFVSFYSARQGIPARLTTNHYRFVHPGQSLYDSIRELLTVFKYELPHKQVTIHFGWPLSSWVDRMAIGVMVYSIMKLPKHFPEFNFVIEYFGKKAA